MKTKTRKAIIKIAARANRKPKVKVIELKKLPADQIFLKVLEDIGRPALVREMATKLQNGKLISKSKKKLMAMLYASASHLNRDKFVKRTPFNNSMNVYSLLSWKRQYHKRKAKIIKHKLQVAA